MSILIASAPVPVDEITTLEFVAPVKAIVKSSPSASDTNEMLRF